MVDTSVWSLALRRKQGYQSDTIDQLRQFIDQGERIFLLGVIVQELLSGITSAELFKQTAEYLAAFPLINLERQDYVEAARLRNNCRRRGIGAGAIDFLIASACIENDLLLFSNDKDFEAIASVSRLKLIGAGV